MTPIEKLSLSERVCYSTLRIEASIPPSSISTGTGFLFNFQIDENKYIPCLVTNKHVIEGSTATSIEISYEKGGEMYHEPISISTSFWILHPNPDVDLCLLPIQLLYNILVSQPGVISFVGYSIPLLSALAVVILKNTVLKDMLK